MSKKLSSYLSTIFFIIVIINFLPLFIKNMKKVYEDALQLKAKVGFIKINDSINEIGNYTKNLQEFFEDKEIKAILIHIESPGGTAGASQALFNEIISRKQDHPKPIVVLTNDLCASGAYYIACAADYIVASPASIIGSIGVYIGSFKFKEFAENWKIKYNVTQSGKYKMALNPFTDTTSEINEFLQIISDDVYNQFIGDVAARRKLTLNNVDKWANGKFFTGKQALELGLVDELGSKYNAVKKIRELALIEKDKEINWVKAKKPSLYEQLTGSDDETNSISFSNLIFNAINKSPFSTDKNCKPQLDLEI